jgi:hypothetical protein
MSEEYFRKRTCPFLTVSSLCCGTDCGKFATCVLKEINAYYGLELQGKAKQIVSELKEIQFK